MRDARRGVVAALLGFGVVVADMPIALAQAVEGPSPPGSAQIASGRSRRPQRPPVDPATRELRQARGLLAGGVVLTGVCGAGFGLFVYSVAEGGAKFQGAAGDRVLGAGAALLACTLVSIAGIGLGAGRLRAFKRSGRVGWTGGLGLRF